MDISGKNPVRQVPAGITRRAGKCNYAVYVTPRKRGKISDNITVWLKIIVIYLVNDRDIKACMRQLGLTRLP